MMNDVITLISERYTVDEIGQRVASETESEIFCQLSSVSQTEWFEAGRNGLKAELRATVDAYDYDGQDTAKVNDARYGIYRTYTKDDGSTELYLERKAGA